MSAPSLPPLPSPARSTHPILYLSSFLAKQTRPSKQPFLSSPASLNAGVLPLSAVGSSVATMGGTKVATAVTLMILPSVATADLQYTLSHNPHFTSNLPPSNPASRDAREQAKFLESKVGEVLRSSGYVDLLSLRVLREKETAKAGGTVAVAGGEGGEGAGPRDDFYRLAVSATVLADDGHLLPALLLSAVAALKDARLPPDEDVAVVTKEEAAGGRKKRQKREVAIRVRDVGEVQERRIGLEADKAPFASSFAFLPPDTAPPPSSSPASPPNPLAFVVLDPDKMEELAALTPYYKNPYPSRPCHWGGGVATLVVNRAGELVDLMKIGGGSGRQKMGSMDALEKLGEIAEERARSVLGKLEI